MLVILSQLISLSNRLLAIENKDSPVAAGILYHSSQCKKRIASMVYFSKEGHPTCSMEQITCMTSSNENRSSIPPKRSRVDFCLMTGNMILHKRTNNLFRYFTGY